MNKKANLIGIVFILFVLAGLLTSCGSASSETPVATEEPAGSEEIQISELVVVLVVDNFTEVEETEAQNDTCIVTTDGQGLSGGRGSSTTILGKPHGFFVYEEVVNQIPPAFPRSSSDARDFTGVTHLLLEDSNNQPADLSFIKRADLFHNVSTDEGTLVVAVDTNGFNFSDIATNIPRAIDLFSSYSGQLDNYKLPVAERIVVNMSFVFVPCDINAAFAGNFVSLLQKYSISGTFESVGQLSEAYVPESDFYNEVNEIPILKNLKSKLEAGELVSDIDDAVFDAFIVYLVYDPDTDSAWLNSESLQDLRNVLKEYSEVIYVGAAGNFGYPYPLVPASWDFVISVSSEPSSQPLPPSHSEVQSVNNGLTLASYSNWGEVQLDGDFAVNPESVYGTSFAAPKFSAKIAQHLLQGSSCPQSLDTASSLPTDPWDNQLYNCTP